MRSVGFASMADGGVSPEVPHWLAPVLTFVGGIIATGVLWLGQRIVGKAAFQTALNDGFAKITKELRDDLAISRQDRIDLRAQLDVERVETANQRTALRNEIAGLRQVVESLQRRLRAAGLPTDPQAPHTPPITADNLTAPAMIILADRDPFGPTGG